MLYWAIFTTGYLIGVFFALGIFMTKDKSVKRFPRKQIISTDVWKNHAELVQVNTTKSNSVSKRKASAAIV